MNIELPRLKIFREHGKNRRSEPPVVQSTAPTPIFLHLPGRQSVRRLAYRLSPSLRTDLTDALLTQARAWRAWGRLLVALVRAPIIMFRQARKPTPHNAATAAKFADIAAPGDILLLLGATWQHPDYGKLIDRQCKANGLRFALLVHDLIPLRRPEWSDRVVARTFRKWICDLLPLCDTVFAVSRATAADVEAFAREQGIRLPGPVVILPLGSELRQAPETRSARLPPPGSYALIVSTIEARKNHLAILGLAPHAGGDAAERCRRWCSPAGSDGSSPISCSRLPIPTIWAEN